MPIPTLHELSTLFDTLPELPPPLPRPKRQAYDGKSVKAPTTQSSSNANTATTSTPQPRLTLFQRVFPTIFGSSPSEPLPQRKPHPFAALKQGKKTIVVAAVIMVILVSSGSVKALSTNGPWPNPKLQYKYCQ